MGEDRALYFYLGTICICTFIYLCWFIWGRAIARQLQGRVITRRLPCRVIIRLLQEFQASATTSLLVRPCDCISLRQRCGETMRLPSVESSPKQLKHIEIVAVQPVCKLSKWPRSKRTGNDEGFSPRSRSRMREAWQAHSSDCAPLAQILIAQISVLTSVCPRSHLANMRLAREWTARANSLFAPLALIATTSD